MKMLIVTGMPGSGKEELLNVARTMDIPFVRMGDVVRDFYKESGAEEQGLTVGQMANRERELRGPDIWAKRSIEKMSGDLFLIDGCRSLDEVRSFRRLGDTYIFGVHAPRSVRFERLMKRGREDAPKNIEEFDERDTRELGWGIGDVIALADFMVINDSDLESFRAAVRQRLEAVR